MAQVFIPLQPKQAEAMPGIDFPQPVIEYGLGSTSGGVLVGSAFPFTALHYPENKLTAAYWQFPIGAIGAASNIIIIADWYSTVASAGNARFEFQMGYQFNGAGGSIFSLALGAVAATSSTNFGGTAFTPNRASTAVLTGIQIPGVFNNTILESSGTVVLKVARNATGVTDSLTGDIRVRSVAFTYGDT